MPAYETVFAVPASHSGEDRDRNVKEIEKIIEEAGGKVSSSEEMGEMEMSYHVKGYSRGYYHLLTFDCPPKKIDDIKKHYRISPDYIRHLIVSIENKQ